MSRNTTPDGNLRPGVPENLRVSDLKRRVYSLGQPGGVFARGSDFPKKTPARTAGKERGIELGSKKWIELHDGPDIPKVPGPSGERIRKYNATEWKQAT